METDIQTSPDLKDLFAALAKAQGEMKPAPKGATNPAFKRPGSDGSKYADLADCVESIRPHLAKHGLCLSQMYAGPSIVTLLGHESGQWIKSQIQIPHFETMNPQQVGSATTYLRRYSLGIVGLVTDEDDDGNAATRDRPAAEVTPIAKGVKTTSPRGDARKNADQKKAALYVAELAKAAALSDEGAVTQLWDELKEDQDTTIVVWDELKKKHGNEFAFISATLKPLKSTGEGRRS